MSTQLIQRNQAAQIYTRALSQIWRSRIGIHDPSLALIQDPDAEAKMLRDADIGQAINLRRHMIAGREWQILPKDQKSPRADLAVAVGTECMNHVRKFTDAMLNLSLAFFSGARFAKIHFKRIRAPIGDGVIRTWFVPWWFEDCDKKTFNVIPHTDEHGNLSAHWERWHVGRAQWEKETDIDAVKTVHHVYNDDQSTLGHGRALREMLAWVWYAKEHVFQESLSAVERFAQGILTAKVSSARNGETGMPNKEVIRAWTQVLEDLRSRHVLVYDKDDDIEVISGSQQGSDLLKDIRAELKSMAVTAILGANLTTTANEGGSYALAEVQENSTESIVQFDRGSLEETLSDSVFKAIWFFNHANIVDMGLVDEEPRIVITKGKEHDPKVRAEVAEILLRNGVSLAKEEIHEQTGFRQPEPGEEVVEGATQALPLGGVAETGAPGSGFFRR